MTHVISGRMSHSEVADILRQHNCREFTEEWTFEGLGSTARAGGGWADVFKARTTSGFLIAIKRTRLFTAQSEFPRILRQSAHELHIWSKCNHPNVLPLLGFAEWEGQFAMISPWMEGGDVRAFIHANPNTPDRLNMCLQIANGLSYFHENHMVHGDLKAQNALVSANGTVMLTDLGSSTIKNQSLTVSTVVRGMVSVFWMAPEMTKLNDPAAPSSFSDIYALGMVGHKRSFFMRVHLLT
ncbi:unnamed protein product [Rhizoctonia solani]|uniref:Protein kinase domain-containing protein n=1 Tax=Rhizoctonia solani TaxID=456999 RepID=A0A8H3DDX7_9AGAM|nr:unnamed protein product [Rhizoctonia solani]